MRFPSSGISRGAILVSIAAILWGLDGTVLTPRLFNLDVAFVVLMLHIVPFVIMNAFLFKEYKYLKHFSKEDYVYLGLVSLFGGAIGTLAIVKALFLVNFNHLSVVVVLQKLQPVFALILAYILLKERLGKNFFVWASLAVFASYFLVFGYSLPDLKTGENTLYAALYSLLAAFSFGSATVFGKKVLHKYSFKTGTFYRFFFTTIIMFIYVGLFSKLHFQSMTQQNWIIFLIIALTTGGGAILLYYYGLKTIKASVSTLCELFYPISAIIFDWIFNGHMLGPVQLAAAGVMIISIYMISQDKI